MRTPGNDRELAAGCLFGEGVSHQLEISAILEGRNSVRVELRAMCSGLERLERRFYTSSSCGFCGKVCIEAVAETHFSALPQGPVDPADDAVAYLPERLRAAQEGFDSTGGLHAAALFSSHGEIRALYEDVGRHNAVDKLIGAELLAGRLPLHDTCSAGERARQLRTGAKGGRGGSAGDGRDRRAVQPGGGPCARSGHDAGRLCPRHEFQHLLGRVAHRGLAMKRTPPKKAAAGLPSVFKTLEKSIGDMGVGRSIRVLGSLNQKARLRLSRLRVAGTRRPPKRVRVLRKRR
jgi:hypothetical protein